MTPLLLLHGALGSAAMFDPLAEVLASDFAIHRLNFSGHGGAPFSEEGFGIEVFGKEVLAYLDERKIEKIDIFGYSMGGYVALWLAHEYPDRVGKVFTLATKFAWSPEAAAAEAKMLNPEAIAAKVPKFASALDLRHAPQDWVQVVRETAGMMKRLGDNPTLTAEKLKEIQHPCLVTVGDQDQMVSREESKQAAEDLGEGEFACMAETPHPLEKVDTARLGKWIKEFIQG